MINCFKENVSVKLTIAFMLFTITSIVFYFFVACKNPGFIMGSNADVVKKAGAYNPKDY